MDPSAPIPTLDEFLACCQAECEFLVTEFGFERLPSPREYNDFSVRFRKGVLGVDIYGENWGKTASCDLVRGEDSLYLGLLIPAVPGARRKRKGDGPGQLAQVHHIANLLRLHASDFLRGENARFDVALAEWRLLTRPRELTEAERMERGRQLALAEAGHASKRSEFAEVVRLLEPYIDTLTPHQRRLLEIARARLSSPS